MNIITLTTDFGTRDYSVGALKGQLFSLIEDVQIVDISHYVEPFNIAQASYILRNAYKHFPKNTIHIVGVDSELTAEKNLLILRYFEQYFVCSDNGFISLFTDYNTPEKEIFRIKTNTSTCFPTLDIVPFIVQKITQNIPLEQLGEKTEKHLIKTDFAPIVSDNRIVGRVVYIDHYGNVISNISKKLIEEKAAGRRFDVHFRFVCFENQSIEEILIQYNAIEKGKNTSYDGEKFILFNHANYLELAIYRSNLRTTGGACSLLGINNNDQVSVNFITQ